VPRREPRPAPIDAASPVLRVALVGYGTAGAIFHGPLLANSPGYELAAIVTRDDQRKARAARDFPRAQVLEAAEPLWKRVIDVDLVIVATPNRHHVELTVRSLDAGLPVVVDKPLAVTVADAERLVALSRASGVLLTVFQNRRWDCDFLAVEQVIRSGELGPLVRLESHFELFVPFQTGAWRERSAPEEGGGVLLDLGSHLIDQVHLLFGEPEAVYAELGQWRAGAAVEDDVFLELAFGGNLRCHLWMSKVVGSPAPRFRVIGLDGALEVPSYDPQWAALQSGVRPGDAEWGRSVRPASITALSAGKLVTRELQVPRGSYERFYAELRQSLLAGSAPPVDPMAAVQTLRVIDAARTSARDRRIVSLSL
jgi:scyllo-inositol 2-dehydrogenase (NADP+)